jgi:hypothetical protein
LYFSESTGNTPGQKSRLLCLPAFRGRNVRYKT